MSELTVRERAIAGGAWPFGALPPFSYDLIMIDPPWPTRLYSEKGEGKSFARHYGAMTFADIAALPVGALAAKNAVLFVWCTWPLLLHGGNPQRHYEHADASRSFVGEAIRAWGFRYVTGGAWVKRTSTGKAAFGTGYRLRSATEPFLIAVSGAPKTTRSERNLIEGLAREHSRKPDEAFLFCQRWMPPGARLVELFSRQSRPGFDTWGHEAGKLDPIVTLNATPLQAEAA